MPYKKPLLGHAHRIEDPEGGHQTVEFQILTFEMGYINYNYGMDVIMVKEAADKWGISEQKIRKLCRKGAIAGAFKQGNRWMIPADFEEKSISNPPVQNAASLLVRLREEKDARLPGGIYQELQIRWTYHSNHMEGNALREEQIRWIYETGWILCDELPLKVDDILETVQHFRCIDLIIDKAMEPVTVSLLFDLHRILKTGTEDAQKPWFVVGGYKKLENTAGHLKTVAPDAVPAAMDSLLAAYSHVQSPSLEDLLQLHVDFERIHPFQDGNGRVGRLLLLKECLRWNFVPVLFDEQLYDSYGRGLAVWQEDKDGLLEAALAAQKQLKPLLAYFDIECGV